VTAAPARALEALAQAGMFAFGIVMALIGAVVPSLVDGLGLTLAGVGTLFLAMNSAMLLASLVMGLVMDRVGLKMPLAGGAALVAAGLAVVAGAGSQAPLLVGVSALGFGGGALNATTNTLVSDLHDDPGRKAAALNGLGVFFGFGALILPFAIGALTATAGIAALLRIAALLCGAIAIGAVGLRFPPPKQLHGWPLAAMPRFARMRVVWALALLLFFESGNEFMLGGYITSLLTRELAMPAAGASYALAAYWASIMAIRLVLARALVHVGGAGVVLASALCAAGGVLLIAAASSAAMAVGGAILAGLALGGIFPTLLGLTGARFREHSGTVFGILFTAALCGGMTLPWMAGRLADAAGVRWVFALAAVNFLVVAAVSLVATRSPDAAAGGGPPRSR
jgi:fucose permease